MVPQEQIAVSPKGTTPGKKPKRRWPLLATAAILTWPWMLLIAIFVARDDSAAAERALHRDVRILAARQYPRPTHAPPWLPGSFGEGVQPHLPNLVEAYRAWKSQPEEAERDLLKVIGLELPPDALPPEAELDRLRPAIEGVLLSTHRARGDPPEEFSIFHSLPFDDVAAKGLFHGGKLGLALLARQLEEGDPEAALCTCLDTLALGRDLAFGAPLLTRVLGASLQSLALSGCAAAITRSSADAQRLALDAILTIRSRVPPFKDTVLITQTAYDLYYSARVISDLDALPPGPRAMALQSRESTDDIWLARPFVLDAWSERHRRRPELERISRLPETEQVEWFEAHRASSDRRLNPFISLGTPDYAKYILRSLGGRRSLTALALVSALELHRDLFGSYPRTQEDLPDYETIFEDEPPIEVHYEVDRILLYFPTGSTADEEGCLLLTLR